MRRCATKIRRFSTDQSALAVMEFALILPVLLVIMLGGLQLLSYVNAVRKINTLAQSMSQMLTQATPPSGSTTAIVNNLDLHFAYDAALVLFPYVMQDAKQQQVQWWQDIQITFSSIAFTKIPGNCTDPTDLSACYVANVVWSSVTASSARPCIVPQVSASNTAAPSPKTLPKSVFGPASLIVVDVVFTFRPTFGANFIPPVKIMRSVYMQPRYASLINYDTSTDDGSAVKCPGY